MKLYHFCSKHHIKSIVKNGLALGCVPVSLDPIKIAPGFQWLTKNKSFKQEWCKHSTLSYKRNDYRITIKIPLAGKKNLIRWIPLWKKLIIDYPGLTVLNDYADPWNWYVYHGIIPNLWFSKIRSNPKVKDFSTTRHCTVENAGKINDDKIISIDHFLGL